IQQTNLFCLVARERSGHTAVVEENLLYVWGGYMSIADDEVFLPNDEIWAYDLQQGVWEVFHMTGEVPPSMSGTCGCSLNGHMYIFGGCDDNGQTNQIYCVNLTDGKYTWKKIIHEMGSPPSPRDKLSCWIYKGSWNEPQTHVNATTRCYVFAKFVFDCIVQYIFYRIPVTNNPVGRSWHTLTAVSDSTLFLFGGLSVDCKPMSDGWLLDVETKKWREVEHPYKNKPRLWHTACPGKDSDVVVFGGSCDYILLVDTVNFLFSDRICEDYIAKNVRNNDMLRNQLTLLPPKLLTAVQRRISFYRPSKKKQC
uniref:Kelch domain containing 1 n=1 Tax=Seriola dumerili TaxID=41447 RepID=A0A3B4USP5_SERDU